VDGAPRGHSRAVRLSSVPLARHRSRPRHFPRDGGASRGPLVSDSPPALSQRLGAGGLRPERARSLRPRSGERLRPATLRIAPPALGRGAAPLFGRPRVRRAPRARARVVLCASRRRGAGVHGGGRACLWRAPGRSALASLRLRLWRQAGRVFAADGARLGDGRGGRSPAAAVVGGPRQKMADLSLRAVANGARGAGLCGGEVRVRRRARRGAAGASFL
ncbi:hypothetical protein H632_c3708p0, partial [Helicosporidium sp. ATCC 50920]